MTLTRSQFKKIHRPSKKMAASIIQVNYRKYLNNRYKKIMVNSEDIDIISREPVKLIPRKKLWINNKRGYNGIEFLKWVNTFDDSTIPKHPLHMLDMSCDDLKDLLIFGIEYIKNVKNDSKKDILKLIFQIFTNEIKRCS